VQRHLERSASTFSALRSWRGVCKKLGSSKIFVVCDLGGGAFVRIDA
jgi:hypothetical protein